MVQLFIETVKLIIYIFLITSYALNVSAGVGLLIWSKVYRHIYDSFLIEKTDYKMKNAWNIFYHIIGGGLSYHLYYWLHKRYAYFTSNLVYLLYLILYLSVGFLILMFIVSIIEAIFP